MREIRLRARVLGALAAAVVAATAMLVAPAPAHADQVLDQALCPPGSAGSLTASGGGPVTWGDTITVNWSVSPSGYCTGGASWYIAIYADGQLQYMGQAIQGAFSLTPMVDASVSMSISTPVTGKLLASTTATVDPYVPPV